MFKTIIILSLFAGYYSMPAHLYLPTHITTVGHGQMGTSVVNADPRLGGQTTYYGFPQGPSYYYPYQPPFFVQTVPQYNPVYHHNTPVHTPAAVPRPPPFDDTGDAEAIDTNHIQDPNPLKVMQEERADKDQEEAMEEEFKMERME